MDQDEADRLHEGLRRSFADICGHIEDARLEDRAGYRVVVCPRVPFPGLNGMWAEGPDADSANELLEEWAAVVEGVGG